MENNKEINATIGCMGYGYQVKVLINGVDIGVKGGQSESKRLFSMEHSMKKEAPPEWQARLFVLKAGENDIHIEFKKTGVETDKLTFDLNLENQIDPYLSFTTTDTSGTFDKKFVL